MKNFISLCFAAIMILIFTACDSSTEPNYEESYFPLKVGNTWYFTSFLHTPENNNGEKQSMWEVTGTKTIGSQYYFEITETSLIRDDIPPRKVYYYIVGNKLYIYDEERNQPGLFADFGLEKEQSFKYFDHNVTVTEKTDTTITYFYDHPSWVDEEHWITFEKGTGIKSHFSVWGIGSVVIEKTIL